MRAFQHRGCLCLLWPALSHSLSLSNMMVQQHMKPPLCPCPEQVLSAAPQAPAGTSDTRTAHTSQAISEGRLAMISYRLVELHAYPAELRFLEPCSWDFPATGSIACCRTRHILGLCLCGQPRAYQKGKKGTTCTSCSQLSPISPVLHWGTAHLLSTFWSAHAHCSWEKHFGKVNISRHFSWNTLTFQMAMYGRLVQHLA